MNSWSMTKRNAACFDEKEGEIIHCRNISAVDSHIPFPFGIRLLFIPCWGTTIKANFNTWRSEETASTSPCDIWHPSQETVDTSGSPNVFSGSTLKITGTDREWQFLWQTHAGLFSYKNHAAALSFYNMLTNSCVSKAIDISSFLLGVKTAIQKCLSIRHWVRRNLSCCSDWFHYHKYLCKFQHLLSSDY